MKKRITLFVLILASMAWGQDVFEKYEYDDNVTYFSISPKMFQMLAFRAASRLSRVFLLSEKGSSKDNFSL